MKAKRKSLSVRSTCGNNLPVWGGPNGGIKYECYRYGRPCNRVKTCPYKVGTTVTDFIRNNI
jgi:hypothetical protein